MKNIEKHTVFSGFWAAHRADVVKTLFLFCVFQRKCPKNFCFVQCYWCADTRAGSGLTPPPALPNPAEPLQIKHLFQTECLGNIDENVNENSTKMLT